MQEDCKQMEQSPQNNANTSNNMCKVIEYLLNKLFQMTKNCVPLSLPTQPLLKKGRLFTQPNREPISHEM
jgi:hypothetical protein